MVLILVCVMLAGVNAQLKPRTIGEQSASSSLVRPTGSLSSFFGLLNPESFIMRHSLSYNYLSAGGTGISTANYTNSMFYQIADPLNVRLDLTVQGSPFGPTGGADRNAFNRVFLSRAELTYRPWENFMIQVQYRDLPYNYYRRYDNPFNFGRFGDFE